MKSAAWLLFAVMACDRGASPTGGAASTATAASTETPTAIPPPIPPPTPPPTPTPTAAADAPPPDAIIAQHILVTYKGAKRSPKTVTRSKSEAKARAAEALAKVRAGMPFEDAVKAYSDDAATVDRLGSLGKFRRDAMDPAFGSAAFALKTGEVSDVVETPFGFHVIKRTQ